MSSADKPETEIIEDDEKLDEWYQQYTRDIAIKVAQATGRSPGRRTGNDTEKARMIHTFGGPDAEPAGHQD